MKTIVTILLCGITHCYLANPFVKHVNRFIDEHPAQQKIFVEFSFAQAKVLNPEKLDLVRNKKIRRIRYIYSRFKESETFVQTKLDKQRFQAVKKLAPQLSLEKTIYIEQIACNDHECAAELFHGFEILYTNDELFSTDNLEVEKQTLNGSTGGDFITEDGLVFIIPDSAFIDVDGNIVTGKIDFLVKSAIDPLSILMGNLETATSGHQALQSGGMFATEARSNGKELRIRPGKVVQVSVPTREKLEGMQLYSADVKNGTPVWKDNPREMILDSSIIMTPSFKLVGTTNYLEKVSYSTGRVGWKEIVTRLEVKKGEQVAVLQGQNDVYKEDFEYMSFTGTDIHIIKTFFNELLWVGAKDGKYRTYDTVSVEMQRKVIYRDFYTAQLTNLGWCNIDRMMSDYGGEELRFCASLEELAPQDVSVRIILPEQGISVMATRYAENLYFFDFNRGEYVSFLPSGKKALIIAQKTLDSKRQLIGVQEVTVRDLMKTPVNMEVMSLSDARELLKDKLGKHGV